MSIITDHVRIQQEIINKITCDSEAKVKDSKLKIVKRMGTKLENWSSQLGFDELGRTLNQSFEGRLDHLCTPGVVGSDEGSSSSSKAKGTLAI